MLAVSGDGRNMAVRLHIVCGAWWEPSGSRNGDATASHESHHCPSHEGT